MTKEKVATIARDLHQRIGQLKQGNTDLITPNSPLKLGDMKRIVKDFYSRVADYQTGPFSSLGIEIDSKRKREDELSQELLKESEQEDNSPLALFATTYTRTVERALRNPNLAAIYEQGIIQIRHPLGFFALYNPQNEHSTENLILIVPGTSFDVSGLLDKNDSVIYIYNPNTVGAERLSAYVRRQVKNKYNRGTSYTDRLISPWNATLILRTMRDHMDQRPGTISPLQTPLR